MSMSKATIRVASTTNQYWRHNGDDNCIYADATAENASAFHFNTDSYSCTLQDAHTGAYLYIDDTSRHLMVNSNSQYRLDASFAQLIPNLSGMSMVLMSVSQLEFLFANQGDGYRISASIALPTNESLSQAAQGLEQNFPTAIFTASRV